MSINLNNSCLRGDLDARMILGIFIVSKDLWILGQRIFFEQGARIFGQRTFLRARSKDFQTKDFELLLFYFLLFT
jgi:hypothetical protein